QLSVLLAQMNEGRAGLRQVEEARFNEDEKWIAFYDAQFSSEKARLNVLKHTGELTAALR
ncbi:MAG: outer membrane protein, partial [Bryobacterales bacterium]|nr:outer membrane protein [Bryobacterales bacterium]